MTKDEYKTVCVELGIVFRETGYSITPEQLTIKAQLLQKFSHFELQRVNSIAPEIIIYLNDKIIDVYFGSDMVSIFFMDNISDHRLAKKHFEFIPLNEVVAKIDKYIAA
jgi:hypothetical protein